MAQPPKLRERFRENVAQSADIDRMLSAIRIGLDETLRTTMDAIAQSRKLMDETDKLLRKEPRTRD